MFLALYCCDVSVRDVVIVTTGTLMDLEPIHTDC